LQFHSASETAEAAARTKDRSNRGRRRTPRRLIGSSRRSASTSRPTTNGSSDGPWIRQRRRFSCSGFALFLAHARNVSGGQSSLSMVLDFTCGPKDRGPAEANALGKREGRPGSKPQQLYYSVRADRRLQ